MVTRNAFGVDVRANRMNFRLGIVCAMAAVMLLLCGVGRADEPFARNRDYDLQHVKTALKFDIATRGVTGETTQTLAILRDGTNHVEFDSIALTISAVTVNGKAAKFTTTDAKLIVELGRDAKIGEKFDVDIRYTGNPKKGL